MNHDNLLRHNQSKVLRRTAVRLKYVLMNFSSLPLLELENMMPTLDKKTLLAKAKVLNEKQFWIKELVAAREILTVIHQPTKTSFEMPAMEFVEATGDKALELAETYLAIARVQGV